MHPRTGWGDHSGLLSRSCSAGKDGVLFAFLSLIYVVQRLSQVLGQLHVLFLGVRAYLWEHVGVARGLSLWPWFALGSPLCAAFSFKETET